MKILYHYCSNNSFHLIVDSRKIRLSSLSLSNDTMEGKLVAARLVEMAKDDGLDKFKTQLLEKFVFNLEDMVDGLGFCLSEVGDLLSQWRAYADDATGFSIGFSKDYLEKLEKDYLANRQPAFTLKKVEYKIDNQKELIKPTYTKIKELIEEGALDFPKKPTILSSSDRGKEEAKEKNEKFEKAFIKITETIFPLFTKLFLLKATAFKAEREWRLLSYFGKKIDEKCSFRALKDRIVPYKEFDLLNPKDSIVRVILGSKNKTPDYVIKSLLNQKGFTSAKILRSKVPYQ
jgi:hypothetical protein